MEFILGFGLLIGFALAAFGFGMWASYEESLFFSALVWIALIAGLHFAFGIAIFSILGVVWSVALLLAYIALGGLYTAFIMWPRWLHKNNAEIKEAHKNWSTKTDQPTDFFDSIFYNRFSASRNKERLATWVLMWIFNISWDLLHKPIIWTYETVYKQFGNLFNAVGKSTVSKILEK